MIRRATFAISVLAAGTLFLLAVHTQTARSSYIPSNNLTQATVRYTITNVSITSTGTTKILTTDTKKFIPTSVVITTLSLTGAVTAATVSVGSNATSYNNIMGATSLSALNAVDKFTVSQVGTTAAGTVIGTSTDIFFDVTSAAVASAETVQIDLYGYYES